MRKCQDCNKPQIDERGCESGKSLKWWKYGTAENDHGHYETGLWLCDACYEKRWKNYPWHRYMNSPPTV